MTEFFFVTIVPTVTTVTTSKMRGGGEATFGQCPKERRFFSYGFPKANFQDNINLGSEDCRKDTGEPTKLRRRDPLYKSEGPTQVALLMLKYLMKILKGVEPEHWHKYFLSYDNMCHVERLKLLRNSLALEEPFSTVWLDIN